MSSFLFSNKPTHAKHSQPVKKVFFFLSSLFYLQNMTPTTLLIQAVCWTRVIYELRKGNCLPYSLCGSVVKHRSAESEGLRFDSSWGMFSLSYARDETKNTFLFFFTDLKKTIFLLYLQGFFCSTK